jgi:GT2 family glycosyltransferase
VSPVVTVIIPTFNRCPLVGAAIESVLSQSYDDFELIVVDDGSTDGTAAELAKFGLRLRLFCQANHGVSSARNFAAREARGHYLAFLDSDDLWHPKKLEIQTDFMERNPSIQICQTEEIWIRNGTRVNPKSKHRKPSGDIFTPSLELCLVSPSAVMLTRELFNQVGGFDERFPVCEDYDLWLRIAKNHPVPLIADPLVIKRGGHADQLSRSIWGLDRYRVMALQKLLRSELGGSQRQAAVRVLRRKVAVLAAGARKRDKAQDAVSYENILAEFDQGRSVGNGNSRIRDGQGNSAGDVGALA